MNGNARVLSTEQYPEVQFGKIILAGDMTQTGNNTINGYLTVGNTVSILATGVSDTGTGLQISKGGIDLTRGAINNNYCCKMVRNSLFTPGGKTKITGLSSSSPGFNNTLANMADNVNSKIVIQRTGKYFVTASITAPNASETTLSIVLNGASASAIASFNHDGYISGVNGGRFETSVIRNFNINDTLELYVENNIDDSVGGSAENDYTILSIVLLN